MVLVANKIDLENQRTVSMIEGMELAKKLNCPYFETSAKTRFNVENSFSQLVRDIRKFDLEIENKKRGKKSNACSPLIFILIIQLNFYRRYVM